MGPGSDPCGAARLNLGPGYCAGPGCRPPDDAARSARGAASAEASGDHGWPAAERSRRRRDEYIARDNEPDPAAAARSSRPTIPETVGANRPDQPRNRATWPIPGTVMHRPG